MGARIRCQGASRCDVHTNTAAEVEGDVIDTFDDIPTHRVKLIAAIRLRQTGLKGLRNETRQQALAIIQGLRPAPPKDTPLSLLGIRPAMGEAREVIPDHRRLFARALQAVKF